MKKAFILFLCFSMLAGFTTCNLSGSNGIGTPTIEEADIVGKWQINQSYLMYTETPPDTVVMTQNIIITMEADGTFFFSGTSQWDTNPINNVEGSGNYIHDRNAGTLEMTYTSLLIDGSPMVMDVLTYNCEITETTMELSSPVVQANYPAENMIYSRL